jgi:hypothetical protein
MRPFAPLVLVAFLASPAAAEPPPILIEATEAATAVCTALGGKPRLLEGYETSRDLNGDGADDFVTDLSRLECADAWSAFCGPSGCPVTAWLSSPDGSFDRFELGRLTGFEIRDETPLPALVAHYAAVYCGQSLDDCTRTWHFDTNAPAEPPIDAAPTPAAEPAPRPRSAAAAPKPPAAPAPAAPVVREPLAPGWTLRHVPGSSPVALGMGTGDIASLAGFCLAGSPFLAVTLHDRPDADTVSLGFAFSQGPLVAEARYEETAGGAYVIALEDIPLAARLAGRDSEVAVALDGRPQGILSLAGSTKSLRAALSDCHGF